jgi:L-ribulose-5-phosphate 4-epimerase
MTSNATQGARDLQDLRETVAISHRLLYHTGLGTTRGHTSARIPGTDTFVIKPWPHIQMHRTNAKDLIVMDLDGNIIDLDGAINGGGVTKVSEWPIHAELYRAYPELGAVSHTHQKWASMIGIAGATVLPVVGVEQAASVAEPLAILDEDKALIRSIEQGKKVAQKMKGAVACHLQNHGMVFAGPNVETVTMDAIHIEYQAEMTWRARLIGEAGVVPKLYMEQALERRAKSEVLEAWEHYWKWVDQHPESLRPRSADV